MIGTSMPTTLRQGSNMSLRPGLFSCGHDNAVCTCVCICAVTYCTICFVVTATLPQACKQPVALNINPTIPLLTCGTLVEASSSVHTHSSVVWSTILFHGTKNGNGQKQRNGTLPISRPPFAACSTPPPTHPVPHPLAPRLIRTF